MLRRVWIVVDSLRKKLTEPRLGQPLTARNWMPTDFNNTILLDISLAWGDGIRFMASVLVNVWTASAGDGSYKPSACSM